VGGGKYFLIAAEYTWRYTDGKAKQVRIYKTVHETGSSEHKYLKNAPAQARKVAKNRIIPGFAEW